MENDTDRKRQQMMDAPVAPATIASQAAINMAADIYRRAGLPRTTPHPDVSENFGRIDALGAGK